MKVQLRRLGPNRQVTVLPVTNDDYTLTAGRGSTSDICILSRYVSRTHFSLTCRNKNFYLYDHGSINGTYINDERMLSKQEYPLPLDSIISVGVASHHQNDPDCIVFAFEICKKNQLIQEKVKTENGQKKPSIAVEVEMRSPPDQFSFDKKRIQLDVNRETIGQICHVSDSVEEMDVEIIEAARDRSSTKKETTDEQDNAFILEESKRKFNNSVTTELEMNKTEMIMQKKDRFKWKRSVRETSNTATSAEIDLFEPEGYADDEIIHAFEAQTQVDDPEPRNTQLSYSVTEDYIEINDSEDVELGAIKTEMRNVNFIKEELQEEEHVNDTLCLDIIKSENKENHAPIKEIKIEDDEFTETDLKWIGKLFKTKEECCSFIQSQRENEESARAEESDSDWVDIVTNCAEELEQIITLNDMENDQLLEKEEIIQKPDITPPKLESVDLPLGSLSYDNSVLVGVLTLSQENQAASLEVETLSGEEKRLSSPAEERNIKQKSKRMKLLDPFEFEDDTNILKPFSNRANINSSRNACDNYNITLNDPNSRTRKSGCPAAEKVFKPTKPARWWRRSEKKRKNAPKMTSLPTAEKLRIRSQRRKKLRELCSSRPPPTEEKKNEEPKNRAPLKVKLTKKNRNEYLCEQIQTKTYNVLNDEASAVVPEDTEENHGVEEREDAANSKVTFGENCDEVGNDSSKVQQIIFGGTEENEVLKENNVLRETSASHQLENDTNMNLIVSQNGRRDLKSCLKKIGYTFMRSNRLLVPLKNVNFNPAPQIKHYVTENKITRKTSSIYPRNRTKTKAENRLFRQKFVAILEMCKWNATWLEECKKMDPNRLPPAFQLDKFKNISQKFPNHDTYMKTFTPLLLLELLCTVIEKWKAGSNAIYRLRAEFINYTEDLGILSEGLGCITCESVVEVNPGLTILVKQGDLITISVRKPTVNNEQSEGGAKKLVWMIFGYVENITITQAESERIKTFLGMEIPKSDSALLLRLEILVKKQTELYSKSGMTVQIIGTHNVTQTLSMCQAVSMLPKSPLCQTILAPNRSAMTLLSPCSEDIFFNGPFDDVQRELVLKLVSTCINRDSSLLQIHGGPGTGKTHVIIAFILQILYSKQWNREDRPKILYCAHSDIVVDHVTLKLKNYRQSMSKESRYRLVRFGRSNTMRSEVRDVSSCSLAQTYDKKILHGKLTVLNEKIQALVADLEMPNEMSETEIAEKSSKLHALVKKRDTLKNSKCTPEKPTAESESSVIEGADIICTTILMCGAEMMLTAFQTIRAKYPKKKIICIADEAVQSKEPESIVPLLLGVTHLILVGDSQQLQPTSRCETFHYGLNQSLFWRIMSIFHNQPTDLSPIFTLTNQYRMNTAITALPNKLFYQGCLKSMNRDRTCNFQDYVVLIDSAPSDSSLADCETRLNQITLNLISEVLITMADDLLVKSFAVITCRKEHSTYLKAALIDKVDAKVMEKVHVSSIENVQGQEYDIVLAVIEPNIVSSPRVNVALTRAKHSLIVLITNPLYKYNRFLGLLAEDACIRGVSSYVTPHMEGQVLKRLVTKTNAAH